MDPQGLTDTDTRFEKLFERYHQPILNYLFRLVDDFARAEELAQDTFVKAYRSLPRLTADANLPTLFVGCFDQMTYLSLHCFIFLIKKLLEFRGIPVNTKHQLGQIIGTYGKAVEACGELFSKYNI